jgi:uncharacterized protein (TIGR02145 family)
VKHLYLFGLILLLPFLGFSQSDYEFWFAAPPVTHQFISPSPVLYQNLNTPIRIYFTTADGPATVTVDQPANPSFVPLSVVVNNNFPSNINLTGFVELVETKPANSILNTGLHITSDKEVTAYYEVESPHNAETWPLLGRNALGYEFIIPSQHHYSNYQYADPPALNSFEILATEDSTTVKIVPRVPIVGHNALDTVTIMLNHGQTWNGSATSGDPTRHLAGSFVLSNKPVAVTISDDAVYIPGTEDNSEDIAGAQLIPKHIAGTEYVVQYATGQSQRDDIYIYAFEDATTITFNDSVRIITRTINRGDSINVCMYYTQGGVLTTLCYIQSNKPILVYHFVSPSFVYPFFGSSPQSTSVVVPPITCTGSRRVVYTMTPPRGKSPSFSVPIIVNKSYLGGFKFTPDFGYDSTIYSVVPGTNGTLVQTGGGTWINWPLGLNFVVTNSKGRFQLCLYSNCPATDTADYAKMAYFSDFSSLNLGADRRICPGDSTLLDAGYGHDTYLWNTGDTSQTLWVKHTGTYWVRTTEVGNCTLNDTINVSNYFYTPVVLGSDKQICMGDSILLDAGPGRSWYDWSTGDSTQTIWVKNSGMYWVKVSDVHCPVSDTILVTSTPVPSVTNNPPSKSICSGDSTNILLTSSPIGANFHWTATLTSGTITGFSADSGLVINQTLLNTGITTGIVTYHITPKIGNCTGNTMDFPVTVSIGDSVKVSITASGNNVCVGTSVTYNAFPVNPGITPVYHWKVNGINSGTNSSLFSYTPVNTDVVTCELTSSLTVCISNNPATSNGITMTVNPNLTVSVTVTPTQNPVCSGTSVTFTAHPLNEGTTPSYQWKVNGNPVGANLPTYTYIPLNGDGVTCTVNSNATCAVNNPATSPVVTMTVNPNLLVSVSIIPSSNPFCAGSSVTFTATPNNGGTPPSYQWKVNGIGAGPNNQVYSYVPNNGDVVTCVLNSNIACPIGNPATSNAITMIVNANLPAGVSITATPNPFCPGSSVTITATPSNGGPLPTYQWKVNGINTGTGSTYTYNPVNGDSVRCIMTSNLSCVTGSPASSSKIILSGTLAPGVSFVACFDTITTVNAKPIKLKGGIPLGGTYSGPGVNSGTGTFTPALAGVGTKTITYSYTNAALCSASKSISILNLPSSTLTCGNALTDPRDNKVYQTVQIGSQCWLASNLNFGTILASSQDQRDNCIAEKYCYNDNPINCTNHGGLYQWDEVMRFDETPADQGYCPPGWHIPSENDWNILFAVYINSGFAGSPLKYSGYSGFNALLSGARHINRGWDFNGFATFFWSSTPRSDNKAWAHGMNEADPSVSLYPSSRVNAFSVRCLKD